MGWKRATYFFILFIASILQSEAVVEDRKYWTDLGKDRIKNILERKDNNGVAKNVILFVGDGMGMSTITAGRIFQGQLQKKSGEEGYLSFEKFNHIGLLKTYNVDRQVPDSAGTATAIFSGVKTNYYIVGMEGSAKRGDCDPNLRESAKVKTIIDWAIAAGKSTGIVTTTRITHATPASAYAGSFDRDWECDSKIPADEKEKGCKDIARQLVEEEPGRSINVIFGGGEQVMVSGVNSTSTCTRSDGKNLPYEWMRTHKARNHSYIYVKNKNDLTKIPKESDYVLGLFAPNHLPFDKDRNVNGMGEPSLEEMTAKAIEILQKNDKGYVLIVEGGRIDHAHHLNYAKIAIEEVVAFDKAIRTAYLTTSLMDTLILVTADHSHSFSINGYPKRGNPIDGIGSFSEEGFPYQTLSYINGPGYDYHRLAEGQMGHLNKTNTMNTWRNLNTSAEATASRESLRTTPHHAGIWNDDETHGGEDVPIYAAGPMAHLVEGVHEQTHVAYVVAYSSCIGPFAKDCRESAKDGAGSLNMSPTAFVTLLLLAVVSVFKNNL